jgi:hypothetical protein
MLLPFGDDGIDDLVDNEFSDFDLELSVGNEDRSTNHEAPNDDDFDFFASLSDSTSDVFSNTIEIQGNMVHKSHLINSLINCTSKQTINRQVRTHGLPESCFSINDTTARLVYDESNVYISDILCTVASNKSTTPSTVVLALFLINKIEHKRDQVEFVGNDKLQECLFEGKFLQLEDLNDSHVKWSGKYIHPVKRIEGQYCCAIKTEIEENSANVCKFSIKNLLSIKSYFQSLFASYNLLKSNIILCLRYSDKINSILTIIEPGKDDDEKVKCNVCSKLITKKLMRGHVGAHILLKGLDFTLDSCGFCGTGSCRTNLSISSGYGVNKTYRAVSKCTYFTKFNLKSISKTSKNSPCTNRPVKCDVSECTEIIWSYAMKLHFEKMHPLVEFPTDFVISEQEFKLTTALIK